MLNATIRQQEPTTMQNSTSTVVHRIGGHLAVYAFSRLAIRWPIPDNHRLNTAVAGL